MSRQRNVRVSTVFVCAVLGVAAIAVSSGLADRGGDDRLAVTTERIGALQRADGAPLLPVGATVDRMEWVGHMVHVDLTVPDDSAAWQPTDLDVQSLSRAIAAPFWEDSAFAGTIVRVRIGAEGAYRALGDLIVDAPQPAEVQYVLQDGTPGYVRGADGTRGIGGPVTQGARQPAGALTGVTIFVSAGHGWTAGTSAWYLQRPVLLDMAEDYGNIDQLNYFVNYAFNAGATVVPFRPVGWQPLEIVLDNDDPAVTFLGTWGTNTTNPKYFGQNAADRYRWADTDTMETATARYAAAIPETGFYPVYCFAIAGENRVRQTYRISHSGGLSEVVVDHRLVGNGWIWLGDYYLEVGGDNYVEIPNLSPDAGVVVADAIRWGNGMGDIPRTSQNNISGYPRDEECSRYWAHSELGNRSTGFDDNIWDIPGSDDGSDNVRTAAKWAREMNQEPAGGVLVDRWKRIYLEFHTNAAGCASPPCSARGQITLITDLGATTYQEEYALILSNEVDADLTVLHSEFEYSWVDRASPTYTSSYGAICTPANGDEFDATIVELAFHDNEQDAALLRDSRVRSAMARACLHGIIRFLNTLPDSEVPVAFPPDTPRNVQVVDAGGGDVVLSWVAPLSDGARGDPATGYVIYESATGYGFGNPVVLGDVLTHTLSGVPAGETRYYRIAATNAAGESMPSEVLAVRRPTAGTADVLLVNGFDRLRRQQNRVQEFAFPPAYAGNTVERQQWRRSNSYDYVITHAEALAAALPEYGFSSCANEAVSGEGVNLGDYRVVVWICGEESTEDSTFDSTERTKVSSYLNLGGALFVTGSDIGYDLDDQNNGRTFYESTLKANFVARDAGTYGVTGASGSILSGIGSFDFDPANGAPYDADQPDQIMPQTGAVAALSYVGGAGGTAAVQYEAACGRYRVMMFAFPFETITSAAKRAEVMATVIPWLAATPGPVPFDTDNDCVVTLADYARFAACLWLSGPNKPFGPAHTCIATWQMDQDGDLDVDMVEFALFQEVFGGP